MQTRGPGPACLHIVTGEGPAHGRQGHGTMVGVDGRAQAWFERATSDGRDNDVAALVAAKRGRRVSVVIPARNEEPTIGAIVAGIHDDLVRAHPLVDELVVIDSDSTDATSQVAADAGARVHSARSIRPDLDGYPGKGEAIWKSLFVTTGELMVCIDADLTGWGTHFVPGLLGPLLNDERVRHVKGFYDRVLDDGSGLHAPQGGRVTELVARPLLNLWRPELAAVVQPLAGEWAVRRDTLSALPVPTGYGVEIALLLDVHARWGLDALAQVDLGARAHSHQAVHDLGVMATEIIEVAARRVGAPSSGAEDATLWQYVRAAAPPWRGRDVPLRERPPAAGVAVA
ncbi:glucosyl-3-phosphoglycerate synthase [uncultured Jatrophihabitans sp.]|uniref:glucosyl-3-phosphoglycerate synthase n=1 Tax=uncultured Jatrophihabitans sp. TaxID=1610747 RepID=UPI0035CBB6E5